MTTFDRTKMALAQDTITRPANTTPYTAADGWTDSASAPTTAGGAFNLALATGDGRGGLITDITLTKGNTTNTNGDFDILFFSSIPTLPNDNAAFAATLAQMQGSLLGAVSVVEADWKAGGANGAYAHKSAVNIGFITASDSRIVYGVVVVRGAYTPASGEVLGITAKGLAD